MDSDKIILIIDDEEDLRDTIEYSFTSKGFKVITAVDGVDGLEKLETVKPDLIILDMNMPRMNGVEFYGKIKGMDEKPKYPVLVLTARANMEQLFKELDVDGFMAKPFELRELVKEAISIIKKDSSAVQKEYGSDEKRARKVFIVENNKEIFNKLAILFLEAGYIVNSAQSGASSIKRITMDIPDVIVAALSLHDISGDIVIGKLRRLKELKKTKFILYAASSREKEKIIQNLAQKEEIDLFVKYTNINDIVEASS